MCNSITYDLLSDVEKTTKDLKTLDYLRSRIFNDYLILGKTQFSEHDIEEIIHDFKEIQQFTNPS